MSTETIGSRILIECAWCRQKQLIPGEWAGDVIECLHCGRQGRAYGYLVDPGQITPEPEPEPTREPLKGSGEVLCLAAFGTGFWIVVVFALWWF